MTVNTLSSLSLLENFSECAEKEEGSCSENETIRKLLLFSKVVSCCLGSKGISDISRLFVSERQQKVFALLLLLHQSHYMVMQFKPLIAACFFIS